MTDTPDDLANCDLADRECIPCTGAVPPLDSAQIAELLPKLEGWSVDGVHHIAKEYRFPDFATALAFVNRVGEIAESVNHHPDIWFTWGKVKLEIRTHKIDGLTESDFVLAAKIDRTA